MSNKHLDRPNLYKPKFEGEPTSQVVCKVQTSVAAAGSAQTDAAAILPGVTVVTAADGTKGVIMQNGVPGDMYIIKNNVAAILKVYPPTGAAINAVAANGAFSTAAAVVCFIIIQTSSTQFYTLPLVPS